MQNTVSNSPNSPNQTPDTGNSGYIPARTGAKRRIDAATIAEIAQLCAKQLTESESCRLLGLNPRQWLNWKHKHKRVEKFSALLEEFRAGRIKDLIARVEKSADGEGMKQPDWRAAAFLLSVADSKRFATSGGVSVEVTANVTPIVAQLGGEEKLRKLVEMFAIQASAEIPPPAKPKQIAPAAGDVEVQVELERVK
jgi:hypothetical protein